MLSVADEFFSTVDALGIPRPYLQNISQAIDRSTTAVERARSVLCSHEVFAAGDIAFVVLGSLARHELTICSDLDYLFITDRAEPPSQRALKQAVDELRRVLVDGVVLEPPLTDVFGTTVSLDEIITRIGLQHDDNYNLTRRMLLLEESIYFTGDHLRYAHLARLLQQYGAAFNFRQQRFPRALLHDIVRYWRTVAVDAHATSTKEALPYSRRYLKMLIPRKLNYIASVAPLFIFDASEDNDYVSFMAREFMNPPIVRLARLLATISDRAHPDNNRLLELSRNVFSSLDAFIAKSGDRCWRDKIEHQCRDVSPQGTSEFGDMRRLGNELHSHVTELLLSEPMLPFTRDYLLV